MTTALKPRALIKALRPLQIADQSVASAALAAWATFQEDDRVVVGAWMAAATVGPSGGRIHIVDSSHFMLNDRLDRLFFAGRILDRPDLANDGVLVAVVPISKGSESRSPERTLVFPNGARLLVTLIELTHRLGSLQLLPSEMRSERLSELALWAGVDEQTVIELAAFEPQVKQILLENDC